MPRLMQVMIDVDLLPNEVVDTLRTSIIECGCVSLQAEAEKHHKPIEKIKATFSKMQGVTCDDRHCCITDMSMFLRNLKNIAGGE